MRCAGRPFKQCEGQCYLHDVFSFRVLRLLVHNPRHISCAPKKYSYFIAEQPAPAPHLARPRGCAALRIVLVHVPRVSRSCEHFPDGFDLHLLRCTTPRFNDWYLFQERSHERRLFLKTRDFRGDRLLTTPSKTLARNQGASCRLNLVWRVHTINWLIVSKGHGLGPTGRRG